MGDAPFRRLLPSTTTPNGVPNGADGGPSEPPPPPPSRLPHSFPKARNPVATACEPCRKRKAKCSGTRPCNACHARSVECHYDTKKGPETHVQTLKRKIAELEDHKSSYERVFDLLSSRPEEEAAAILQRIRHGAGSEAILQQVAHGDLLLQVHLPPESGYRCPRCHKPFDETTQSMPGFVDS